jgi:dTDP-D-glucose 4,6-dehydratase
VARVSNVYGIGMPAETFLGQILREGHSTGRVVLHHSGASARDYVSLAAVVRLLPAIATEGGARLYNVAAGFNTSHATIAERLRAVLGWHVGFAAAAPTVCNIPIDTSRLDAEFGPTLSKLSADLPTLLALGHEIQCSPLTKYAAA